MDEPYHRQLHDILIRKGFSHRRIKSRRMNCDLYYDHFNVQEIKFYEDDSMEMFENRIKMKIETFDRLTNNIFSEDL